MSKENGGPAFPCVETVLDADGCDFSVLHSGLSVRDYFAAKAMQVLNGGYHSWADLSSDAYAMADAMLAERAK